LQTHGTLEIHEKWFINEGYLQIHIGSPKLWYGMNMFSDISLKMKTAIEDRVICRGNSSVLLPLFRMFDEIRFHYSLPLKIAIMRQVFGWNFKLLSMTIG